MEQNKSNLKPLELHIENEQKYISYLLNKNASDVLSISISHFLNKKLNLVVKSIKTIVQNGHKLELDILLDEIKKVDQSFTMNNLQIIKDYFTDFDNIEIVKKRLKENYLKQIETKQIIEQVLVKTTSSGDIDLKEIKKLHNNLGNVLNEIENDDENLLFFSDIIPKYKEILNKRDRGEKRTLGVYWLDKYITYPAEPGDMMSIALRKGEGKTTVGLNLMNVQLNHNIPVVYFCFDMGWITILDRWLCLREGFVQGELLQENKTRDQEKRIQKALQSLETIPNFIFYPAANMGLDELDSYLHKAKKLFRDKNVLKENENYCILYFDTLDMLDDFSGVDAYGIKYGVNKLHTILRKHECFAINLLQLNENILRSKKPKELEDVKKIKFTKEDIEGGASYASRSRVVLIGNRPKALMKSFFPEESELIELEEDLMYLNIDKQNDGNTGRLIPPLIFDTTTYRIIPKKD